MENGKRRLHALDVFRGFSVVSMVLFHLCYDVVVIYGVNLFFFHPPFQDIWRASISWVFLLIAGIMVWYSRSNLRRAGKYLAVALLMWVVTTIASVDVPISFGVIFCMGASTLLAAFLKQCGLLPHRLWQALVLAVAFIATLGVPQGYVGIFGTRIAFRLPETLYATPWLAWLGFPGAGFASGDYYPLIPYGLAYLTGTALGGFLSERGWPEWVYELRCRPLEVVGHHALPIYLAHQPLILCFLQLVLVGRF